MKSRTRWLSALRIAAVMALASAAGCSTVSKWRAEHRAAKLHDEEVQEAADYHAEPAAYKEKKRRMAQHDAQLRALQAAVAARGDADSLAAGALLDRALLGYSDAAALDLAARAVAAAPQRADVAFVQVQLCETAPQCDPVPLETHLLQLDPQNGVVWIYVLARMDKAKDRQGASTAFYTLAQSQRIDLYWNQVVAHLAAAGAGTAGFDSGSALTQAIGIETTFTLTLAPISQLCMVPDLQPELLEPCRQIAAAFLKGDTAVIEAYGTSLGQRLWPAGSPQRVSVAAQRRTLRYRVDLMERNTVRLNSPEATRTLFGLVGHYPTEQQTYRAFYQRLGLNPDPPESWKDPAPGH